MCSIFGVVHRRDVPEDRQNAEAEFLLAELAHRGPDAARFTRFSRRVLLGSNRLRVTDPANPDADMPMSSPDGTLAVVFNGEIYNHRALRRRLSRYRFRTGSDTEVLLAAYREWGEHCTAELDGMYAFAIHDTARATIFLACDPTGQKPLYLFSDDDVLIFSSEMDALVRNPHRTASLCPGPVAEYICLRYITGTETHIRQVSKLEAGTWTQIDTQTGHRRDGPPYRVPIGDQRRADATEVARNVRDAVDSACTATFDVEVPYGLLLSGGIDSAAVLAAGTRHGLRFHTYSIGFPTSETVTPAATPPVTGVGGDLARNEFAWSRWLAQRFRTEHTEITLDEHTYCQALDRWSDISGEPLGSQEAPCLVHLFGQARRDVTVMYSGSGPDELFDGYSYGAALHDQTPEQLARAYFEKFQWRGPVDTTRLLPDIDVTGPYTAKLDHLIGRYTACTADPVQLVAALHVHGRLSAYEFRQMDVISMRHGIETRAPLAGAPLMAAAFDFDPALKQLGGQAKGIFKAAVRDLVPEPVAARPKFPFSVPSQLWHCAPFEDRARILFDDNCVLVRDVGMDPDYLAACWRSPDPAYRNIFSRLYTAERLLRRQQTHLPRTR